MRILGQILRVWSCVFCFGLGLFLTALALLIVGTQIHNLELAMLPWWKGATVTAWLFAFGIGGILTGGLAIVNKWKLLLVLYSLAVVAIIVDGYFISSAYHFHGPSGAIQAACFALGALLAFVGSLTQFGAARRD